MEIMKNNIKENIYFFTFLNINNFFNKKKIDDSLCIYTERMDKLREEH